MEILFSNYLVGSHTPFSGKISDIVKTAINNGMYATQFFMGNPKSIHRSKIDEKDIKESLKIMEKYPLHVFSHFPYVSNLCGSLDKLAWNGDNEQDEKTLLLIKSLEYELEILGKLGGGVVIHPGVYRDRQKGLINIAKTINKINFKGKLLLENSAGQGNSLATTLSELKTILTHVEEKQKKYIGICIDTCHLYAYGDYDFSTKSEIDRFFSDFDTKLGLKYLSLIHLNDSIHDIKSRKDRHALLSKGCIWGKSNESLIYLLEKCKELNIPCILETEMSDMEYVCKLN